ncbi:MAG: Txe/YoeB family addiction module toxin [Kiritimatiellaeota bacterium]|nr:Txe/YoeB family addiction module toxin [Kiritimatiellota bacterium]
MPDFDISWKAEAWNDYLDWQHDKQTFRKINALLKDIQRSPYYGIGRPEELKHEMSGKWSREIDGKNRLVYKVENNTVKIYQCRGHYNDR